jgi:hypothetical protein
MALTRPPRPMPPDVVRAIDAAALRAAYDARPAFQRNDDLMCVAKAARPATKAGRLAQMLN